MIRHVYKSLDEVFEKLEPSYGHKFKEYDINHRLNEPGNKGALGQIVEEGILGYSINSDAEADLKELGVEVKTTGVIKNRNGIKAKERLTIDAINYKTIVNSKFDNSPVWEKASDMLLVFYNYVNDLPYGDMRIIKAAINKFSDEDIQIMRQDYDFIIAKIKNGQAQNISEGDTMYLGACTAGTGALQNQPFSSIKAKQRKFCIKQSFFSQLVRKYVNDEEFEHVLSLDEIQNNTFEIALESEFSKYYGMSETKIRERFNIQDDPKAKNRYERYIAKMLKVNGDVNRTEEFLKANINLKTIRVEESNTIEQSMSFPYFEFTDIVKQEWEDSDLRNLFASQKFLLAIFKRKEGELYFERTMFWNMPEQTLDEEVKPAFDELKKVLSKGNIVREIKTNKSGKQIRYNNFPGMADNPVTHVRPHGKDASDTAPLPVTDKLTGLNSYTKQCFWLNNSYVESIISDSPKIIICKESHKN